MKGTHWLPALCHMAIFEEPTAGIYTGCPCKKTAEGRFLAVPQTLLVGLKGQRQGSDVSTHASLFYKRMFKHSCSYHM